MLSHPMVSQATLSKPILDTISPCKNAPMVVNVLLLVRSVKDLVEPSDFNHNAVSGSLSAKPGEPPRLSDMSNISLEPALTTLTPLGWLI